MFIRKTQTKTGLHGKVYFTYRLVETYRTNTGVKQRTVLNLGKHFNVEPSNWALLAKRIEEIVQGASNHSQQQALFDISVDLDATLEAAAQRYGAQIILKYSQSVDTKKDGQPSNQLPDYRQVDINTIDALRPRSIGVESVAYHGLMQLQLDKKLESLGFNRPQLAAAVGNIIGRLAHPNSERETHRWLQANTALGELISHDYQTTSLTRLYTVADDLLRHKVAIEDHLYQQAKALFQLDNIIALYDLTNTYFEGQAASNPQATFGRSKEKRSDCPLVTLALVLDSQGFAIRSEVFAGNASEAKTLAQMVLKLKPAQHTIEPMIVVLDAGIATQENLDWLVSNNFRYLVVSRDQKQPEKKDTDSVVVKEDKNNRVTIRRELNKDKTEVRLYCHSEAKEKKEQGILNRFTARFELALTNLQEGLGKKGTVKKLDKINERIGRIKQKNTRVSGLYTITIIADEKQQKAIDIQWTRNEKADKKNAQAGTYCLRSNVTDWSEDKLWHTYVMLTEIEACFRCMKSELGMRPVYHQKTERVTAHLFITFIAYQIVHTIRYQLKQKGIDFSWECLRNLLSTQNRVTLSMDLKDKEKLHLRVTTQAELEQQKVFDALGVKSDILGKKKIIIEKGKSVVPS